MAKTVQDVAIDKAIKRLVPFLLLMYILAFLDRTNIGFAKNAFQLDTGISDAAFAFGAGVFFIGYAVFEIPSNYIMTKVGPRLWLARIMITWGLIAAGFAFVKTDTQFYVMRFLLGLAEAGCFPGIIYYISQWFPSRRRGTVMGLYYFGSPLCFILGAPISGALLEMQGIGGFHGWQWLFIVEGLAASVFGVWSLFRLTDKPMDAKWLVEEEKVALQKELDTEYAAQPRVHANPFLAMTNWRVLILALIYLFIQVSVYGVTFYLPSQVGTLIGKDVGFIVGVVTAIPWAVALICNWRVPRWADKTGYTGSLAAIIICIGGIGILISSLTTPWIAMIGLCIAAPGFITVQPIFWTMPSRFLSGVSLACAIALINSIGNLGGLIAPPLRVWAETSTGNPAAGLYVLSISAFLAFGLLILTTRIGIGTRVHKKQHSARASTDN